MYLGSSWPDGKPEIQQYIFDHVPNKGLILDVGSGGGTYYNLLKGRYELEAVEIWKPTADYCRRLYNSVYLCDIRKFEYEKHYDLVIFGDILEHLVVEDAQKVLEEAQKHSDNVLVAVPFMLSQEPIFGNQAETHLQPDLTRENVKERYPSLEEILICKNKYGTYGYYWWKKNKE